MAARYEALADPVVDNRIGLRTLPADAVAPAVLVALRWDREITAELSRARNGLVREGLRAGAVVADVATALGVQPDDVPSLSALDDLLGEP